MSYAFIGVCAFFIGYIFYKRKTFKINKNTKQLINNMGWQNIDTHLINENTQEILLKNTLMELKQKNEYKHNLNKVITQLKQNQTTQENPQENPLQEIPLQENVYISWYDRIKILGGYEVVTDFVIVDKNNNL
jgi:hypothetical protein